jgi:hypothetical protein
MGRAVSVCTSPHACAGIPRTLENLRRSIRALAFVIVYDNDDLNDPYRRVAVFAPGVATELAGELPGWLAAML